MHYLAYVSGKPSLQQNGFTKLTQRNNRVAEAVACGAELGSVGRDAGAATEK